jgi:PAS domain S-box-containing protein
MPNSRRKGRPTIGFLLVSTTRTWELLQWWGVTDAARERDVNLICFLGRELHSPIGFDAQANVLYDLVNPEQLDGLVLWAAGFDNFVTQAQMVEFCARYRPLPMVTVEDMVAGIPNVFIDNHRAMRESMVHLIETHGYRRIAFLDLHTNMRGHAGHQMRYQAYVDTLAEYGLPLDPRLIIPSEIVGVAPVRQLLDERGLRPGVDFEAVVGSNDEAALWLLRGLQAEGIRVPEDVALVGYDDIAPSRVAIPPLTTVRPLWYQLGRQAIETLLALLDGKPMAGRVVVPSELVVRQSCGCEPTAVVQAAVGPVKRLPKKAGKARSFAKAFSAQRAGTAFDMLQAAGARAVGVAPEQIDKVLDAFVAEMEGASPGLFLPALESVLRQVMLASGDTAAWQGVISVLRRSALPYLEGEALQRAEDLWQQARVMVGEVEGRAQAYQRLQAEQQAEHLREIGQTLITTLDVEELLGVLTEELPRLGIPSCYLSLYKDPKRPADWSRLILAYGEEGRVEPGAAGQHFPSQQLVPGEMWPQDRRYIFMAEALYFREDQIGFALFEAGPREGSVYEALRAELSSALKGALLLQERKQAEETLAKERGLLRTLIDNVPDYIYFKDAESRFITANAATARLMGLATPGELVNKTDSDFYPQELAEQYYADEKAILSAGQPLVDHEEINLDSRTGTYQWTSTTKIPLRDDQGKVTGLVGIGRDITERKQAEEAIKRRSAQLETAAQVSRAASSILNPDDLIQQAVDLIRERFDLYYAGLFLVDETGEWTGEPGKWAVLRAGTGDAGRQMLERKHKLEIGGTSMIGWCVANKQARIALDVGEEAVRFENPFLPETRSELALPLISRGQVIGALTIQSAQEAAFSDEDIAALQTMADQLANAIQNARLFEQSQAARQQAEARVHEVQILHRIGQSVSSSLDLDHVLDTLVNVLADELEFTYIALNLIDKSAKVLRTVRAIGQAEGLRGLVRSLDQLKNDILMDVIRSRRIEVIDGWDDRFDRELFEREGHAALVRAYVPLLLREEAIGILEVGYRRVERARITTAEIQVLQGLVDQIVIAIENARLFQQAQIRADELTILNEMSRDLTATLDVDMVVGSLYHYASRLMDATNFYVALYNPQRDEVSFPLYAEGKQIRHLLEGRQAKNGLTEYVIRTGRPLLIPENIPDRVQELGCELIGQDSLSWLGVPMMIGQRVIGVVTVQSYITARVYNEHHRDLLSAIASQAAIAIENTHLLQQARVHAEELAVINEIGQTLTARLSVEEVLHDVHQAASRLLDATNFYVAFYDAAKHEITFPFDTSAADDVKPVSMSADQGLTGYVIRNRTSVLIKENLPERLAEMGIVLFGKQALSWLGVPMLLGEQVLGMMSVQSYTVPRAYDEHDLELLTALASQMAIALQNARLFDETRVRARQERAIREISDQMQRAADMETLMRITAEELNRALGGSRAYVRLRPEAQRPADGDGRREGGKVDEG